MDFARMWEQARDLWARPIGKVIFGVVGLVVAVALVGTVLVTRPEPAALGSFSAEDAPKVASALTEKKIPFQQQQGTGAAGFAFTVSSDQVNDARLTLAEVNLDPQTSIWSADLWKNRQSWSNTDFDKRVLLKEQIQTNLEKSLMTMSVVERAKVNLTLPMTAATPLFKEDIKPPKAGVSILPKRGQKLTEPVVRGIMDFVASQVEDLDPKNVTVVDASTSQVVSDAIIKAADPAQLAAQAQATARNDLMSIQQQYQDHWQGVLKQNLELVFGPGAVSVIVNPVINWDKVIQQATQYSGAGKDGNGIPVSSQKVQESSDGAAPSSAQAASGTASNSEPIAPTYPGAVTTTAGNISSDKRQEIYNYLVNETKTTTEKPGGGLESISVGILVNSNKVTGGAETEQKVNQVVTTAMGSKAQVQVAAVPFVPNAFDVETPTPTIPTATNVNWLYWVLGIGLGLGGVAAFFAFTKPRRPVLEPVFAGPEAAMMGGIPITDLELPPPVAASVARAVPEAPPEPIEKRLPETADEVMALPPEEIAALADEFLLSLGVDPAKVRMKERVEKIAKVQPDAVATLLRHWITEERD